MQTTHVSSPASRYRGLDIPILAALAIQVALVAWTFPASELFSPTPLFHIDGAYHWYQMEVARALAEHGRLTGYDPYFGGGYIGGVTLNGSAKAQAALAVLLGDLVSTTVAYKLVSFAFAVIAPCLVPVAARNLRLPAAAVWLSALLGICIWWASGFRWFHTAGMVSFVFASFLCLAFTTSLLTASVQHARTKRVVALGVLGGFGMFVHPLYPVVAALALPAFLLAFRSEIHWSTAIAFFAGVAFLSALPNLPWALSLLGAGASQLATQPYQQVVSLKAIFTELAGLWSDGSMGAKLYVGLMAATLYGVSCSTDAFTRRLSLAALGAWALMTAFAHLASVLPVLAALQPNRFAPVAYLFLIAPASVAGVEAVSVILRGTGIKRATALGATFLLSAATLLSTREVMREVSYAPIGHYGSLPPEVRPLGPTTRSLLVWLKSDTSREGRVLFETSKARIHDASHVAGYLSRASDREFVGGPYPFMFKAGAWDGMLFGMPVSELSRETLSRYLDLYNVGWIVAHTAEVNELVRSIPGVVPGPSFGPTSTFRVDRKLSYFARGSGTVTRRAINVVEFADLQGSEIVVKYHFFEGMRSEPAGHIEPIRLDGRMEPFVRIVSPPGRTLRIQID